MSKNYITISVTSNDLNKRIDKFLTEKVSSISRNRLQTIISEKKVKINNQIIISSSSKIKSSGIVTLEIPEPIEALAEPKDIEIKIIYEDKNLIIIDKKAGMVVHPGAGNFDNTLVNALLHHCGNSLSGIGGVLRPGIVHRIDKNTSGLVVIAKNNISHEHLSNQFSKHTIVRVYQLLVWGKLRPSRGKIETFITRSSRNRQMMEVSHNKGKKAITNYKTLKTFETKDTPTLSLIECKLETGRTHQIRVHMNYLGNSIVGDDKYKKRFKKIKNINPSLEKNLTNLNRQFLHAKTIGFVHPKKNTKMIFHSNLPNELEIILKMLRNAGK